MSNKPGESNVQLAKANLDTINDLSADALRVTWLGHSSSLIEIDGKRFLTDPLWYKRASPFTAVGPKRFFDNPIPIDDLPVIDYILLSHDHYDHLDKHSILYLLSKKIPVITMLGVGKRFIKWGADRTLITELDWWQQKELNGGFTITALPSRHFSGRWMSDRFSTLWGSFAIKGPLHNVYFGADSGYYNGFKKIGDELGPFDLAMLDSGAYNKEWESIHMGPENAVKANIDLKVGEGLKPLHKKLYMGPENAVKANIDLKGKLLMPIHWGTFNLAFHPWKEPVERVIKAAEINGVPLFLPRPGQTRDISDEPYNSRWWESYQ